MTARPKIKVLLIDNHLLVLDGLKAVLESFDHIEVAGTAGLAQTGLDSGRDARPHVVLLDINMPKLNGIDAIELFRKELPEARIVMLSMHDSREYISSSVMRGARPWARVRWRRARFYSSLPGFSCPACAKRGPSNPPSGARRRLYP